MVRLGWFGSEEYSEGVVRDAVSVRIVKPTSHCCLSDSLNEIGEPTQLR